MSAPQMTALSFQPNYRRCMPPIESVKPAAAPLTKKKDADMQMAFGLGNDEAHWSRMKAAAIRVCLAELPPNSFAPSTKERLGLTNSMVKVLRYRGDLKEVTDYVWEYALKAWREVFGYDIQYLQKKYPAEDAKATILHLVQRWNQSCDDSMRRYAHGRDLKQVYLNQMVRKSTNPFNAPSSQKSERSTSDAIPSQMNHAEVFLSQSEQVKRDRDVHWPSVVLDIQYLDQSEKTLDGLAFSFICGPHPCAPGNIQMKIIEDDLRAQNVNIDNFSLRLRGSQEEFGWSLRNICLVLTLWSRTRSDDEGDVRLLLVPHGVEQSVSETARDENLAASVEELAPPIKQEHDEDIGTISAEAVQHDRIITPTHEYHNARAVESPMHAEPQLGVKRERDEVSSSNEQVPTMSSDPRLVKRARQEKKELELQIMHSETLQY